MKLEYINTGIGNRVGNTIYLNTKLKQFPELHKAILSHEKKHTGRFSWLDIKLDLKNEEITNLKGDYYKFILTTPNSWLNFLPFMKIKNSWTYDLGLVLIWIFAIFMGVMIWVLI